MPFWTINVSFACLLLSWEIASSTLKGTPRRRRRSIILEAGIGTKDSLLTDPPLEADFVIVGGGTAGSLLAERLSRIGSVLILECGSELPSSVRSRIPGAGCSYDQLNSKEVCGKRCRKGMRLSKGFRESSGLNFRVGPGGTSVLAVGAHFQGSDKYWKDLAKSYGDHWILPKDAIHRLEHEMSVRTVPAAVDEDHVLFSQALSQHVHLISQDSLGTGGSHVFPRYQDDLGWSTNSYTQFLKKAVDRENVHMLTKACARRLIKGNEGRAPSVEVRYKSQTLHARAKREVILAAGALGSPSLLQKSGLSTAAIRDQADIRVSWHCAHCKYRQSFVKALHTFFHKLNATSPPGALTLPGFDSGGFVYLGDVPALIVASTEFASDYGTVETSGSFLEAHIVLLQPRSFEASVSSSGKARLPTRLTDPQDLDAAVHGIRLVRKIVQEHAALGGLGLGKEVFPGPQLTTDSELRKFLGSKTSEAVRSFQSATASCRLGQVVDGKMRLIGMPKVRVADASVLPRPPLGRTLFPTLVVAEVASALIANTTI